ncbi:MAG: sugar phosphate nucleotidyltransferase [Desulfotignum sp.]|nr:sugar phosphate nucleotidyltransferase [Desulfotignum sp.]
MIVPVILAGGSGTRLWPLSREFYRQAAHQYVQSAHHASEYGDSPQ